MAPGYSTRDKGAEEERCGAWRDYRRGGDEGWGWREGGRLGRKSDLSKMERKKRRRGSKKRGEKEG